MKKIKFDYTVETLLIFSGIIIALFPEIIYKIFTFIGIAVMLFNIVKFILGKIGKISEYPISSLVIGLIFGFFITTIPNMVELGLPLVLGSAIMMAGIERFIRSYQIKQSGGNFKVLLIIGLVFFISGIVILINPFGTSALIRRIAGIILILFGIMKITSDINIKKQNQDIIPDIIDGDFTSDDETKKIK